jgi:hypothetical protein
LLWPGPAVQGEAVSELLPGEDFAVLEYAGGWAWGFSAADHVVSYVEGIALADPIRPTHFVCEKCAPVTPDDAITSPVIATLPMGARLHGKEAGACLITEYGCVSLSHLRAIGDPETDPAIVAERLLGAPFLAGGRSANGIDAPALVQLALSLCGVPAPRLLDQLASFGAPVPAGAAARPGDLVLFDPGSGPGQAGSIGLMIDDLMMIHASRAAGKVVVEPAPRSGAERRRPPL